MLELGVFFASVFKPSGNSNWMAKSGILKFLKELGYFGMTGTRCTPLSTLTLLPLHAELAEPFSLTADEFSFNFFTAAGFPELTCLLLVFDELVLESESELSEDDDEDEVDDDDDDSFLLRLLFSLFFAIGFLLSSSSSEDEESSRSTVTGRGFGGGGTATTDIDEDGMTFFCN